MKLMVLDGNSILNRAYYGIRPLSTRDGLYTHAVYGFITTLQRLLDEENPEALCVTFDRREPTFRHRADAEYKAQRKPMPPELAMQLPVMKQVLSAMSVPCYELAGYEADDLIGTISRKCQAAGWDCVIVTGDKDSLQLITDRTKVKLVSTRMGQTTTKDMTPETFREQYGFDPIHMIDLKALMGDTSDNIPGVPGVGEKTAMALVQEYGAIDEIYRLLPDLHAKPAAIRKLTGKSCLVVGPGIRTGLNIRMDNPTEIGSDLIVASVAAIHDYGAPLLIVDMGTATTITAIDKDGVYTGGCICPGLKISLEALTGRTAQLPGISLDEPQRAIGKNTRDAMRSGIMFGAAAMLDGLLDRMEQELGTPATVVATGGISKFVVPLCRRKLIYDRTLMLKGLNLLYQRNVRA